MYRPFSLFAGLRYTIGRRGDRFVSLISLISLVGLALGVAALIIVLAVMQGFQQEIRDRMLAMVSHAVVSLEPSADHDQLALIDQLIAHPEVLAAAQFQSRQTLLRGYRPGGASVRGIVPEQESGVSDVAAQIRRGELNNLRAGEFGMLLGDELSRALGVGIGDSVTVFSPDVATGSRTARRFHVVGMFSVGMREYDRSLALVHLDDSRSLFGDRGQGIRLRLSDRMQAPRISKELQAELEQAGFSASVRDWTGENPSLFQAMALERVMMAIILSLIIMVAAFNILASLSMAVNERRSDIAILRTMGARPGQIMTIFVTQGWSIGVLGSLTGVGLGLLVALNLDYLVPVIEGLLGIEFMPADMFYISQLPSDVQTGDVIVIASISLLVSLLATLYPSWRASRQQPAQALHAEG